MNVLKVMRMNKLEKRTKSTSDKKSYDEKELGRRRAMVEGIFDYFQKLLSKHLQNRNKNSFGSDVLKR